MYFFRSYGWCRPPRPVEHPACAPFSGRCECAGCPIISEGRYPKPLGCNSPSAPLVSVVAVAGGTGRAPCVMGPHLKEWHQCHCFPAPFFAYHCFSVVYLLRLLFFSPSGLLIPQLLFGWTYGVFLFTKISFGIAHSDNLGIPLTHTLTGLFLSCWLLGLWTPCQGWGHEELVTQQVINHQNIPWKSKVAMGQSCYASLISMLLLYLYK